MTDKFLKIFDCLQRRKRFTMISLFAIVGILIFSMSTITYNENINDFLPLSGNEQKAISLYQDISGGQRIVTLFHLKDTTVDDRGRIAEAIDTFANKLSISDGKRHIKDVTTQVDYDKIVGITDFVYANMPLLLNEGDYKMMERNIANESYIGSQLANDAQMIMMPATSLFSNNISNDPLGLFAPVMARLQSKQSSMAYDVDNGYIYTMNGRYGVALLTSPYGATESANNSLLAEFVDSVARATMATMPDVVIESTGAPIIAVGNAKQIKTDSILAIAIAVTLILALLVFSFRSWKGLLLIGVSIVFGWLFAMGCMAGVKGEISIIVLGIGSIIIGIAVNYPLHFVAHTAHGGTVREVLKDMIAPLLIGNITTVGAFAALIPLDAPALHDLGLFAAFMLVGTILFAIIFLPHLVKGNKNNAKERLSFGKLAAKSPERHRWILAVIAIATLIFGYFSLFTSFDSDMHHINYMSSEQTRLLTSLQASTGVNDTAKVYVVAEGKTWDEALATRLAMKPKIDSLKNKGILKGYTDITSFVNDKKEQQRRIDRWNAFWQKYRQEIMNKLAKEAPIYGFSDDAFDGFRAIVDKKYSSLTIDGFCPLTSTLLATSMSQANGDCSVVDILHVNKQDIENVKSQLNNEIGDRGYAFDFMGMNSAIANSLSDNFNYIGYACGFIVFFFLWLSMGRLELALLSFLPMALGWVWILGIMEIGGMQFNIVNIILATFIFGQGDDYTIFMTEGLIDEYGYHRKLLPSYKNSIVISALIMFIGMGSLIVAEHPALHSLAEVTIVGMFTVVLMAWLVPPLIFGWIVRNGNTYRRAPITIEQIIRTSLSTIVYIFQLGYGCLLGILNACIPGNKAKRELWFHKIIFKSLRFDVNHIKGIKTVINNKNEEDFSKGSITICNHQSILDPIYLLALHPKMLIIIGEKVWRNPIVHLMFKFARFINVGQPADSMKEEVCNAVRDGYNVVFFTEAARSSTGRILRFHKGAFELAKDIHADLLPIFIHGLGDVMPKDSAFAARGQVTIEVGKRIPADDLSTLGGTSLQMANNMRHFYIEHYEQMKRSIENSHYFHHFVLYKYIYKGISVERETKRLLKHYDDFSKWIDTNESASITSVAVLNSGKGQFALLYALVHPDVQVYSYTFDKDDAELASCCTHLPQNLYVNQITDTNAAINNFAQYKTETSKVYLLFPDEKMIQMVNPLHPIIVK